VQTYSQTLPWFTVYGSATRQTSFKQRIRVLERNGLPRSSWLNLHPHPHHPTGPQVCLAPYKEKNLLILSEDLERKGSSRFPNSQTPNYLSKKWCQHASNLRRVLELKFPQTVCFPVGLGHICGSPPWKLTVLGRKIK
jgi:hypothetical protein